MGDHSWTINSIEKIEWRQVWQGVRFCKMDQEYTDFGDITSTSHCPTQKKFRAPRYVSIYITALWPQTICFALILQKWFYWSIKCQTSKLYCQAKVGLFFHQTHPNNSFKVNQQESEYGFIALFKFVCTGLFKDKVKRNRSAVIINQSLHSSSYVQRITEQRRMLSFYERINKMTTLSVYFEWSKLQEGQNRTVLTVIWSNHSAVSCVCTY